MNGILRNWECLCDIRPDCHHHFDASGTSNAMFDELANLYLTYFLLQVKPYANEQKCKQWRQQGSPYRTGRIVRLMCLGGTAWGGNHNMLFRRRKVVHGYQVSGGVLDNFLIVFLGISIYNPQKKSWYTFPLFNIFQWNLSVCPLPPNVGYHDKVVIVRLQKWLGRGLILLLYYVRYDNRHLELLELIFRLRSLIWLRLRGQVFVVMWMIIES